MDQPVFKTLRIAPTTQQGGTQTIQQSIYLTHDNPCGANRLIFQEMGFTNIRYIDLKNYVDDILKSEEMVLLFEQIRINGTEYINNPTNVSIFEKYTYSIINWASHAMSNLPVSENYYPGYLFRVNVYDGSGTMLFDSYYPNLKPFYDDNNTIIQQYVPVLPSNPYYWIYYVGVFKASSAVFQIPFIDQQTQVGFETVLSNFILNQSSTQETVMAVASLLVDSANTRSFGIPRYGFSARQSLAAFAGITYNCSHYIDIKTVPNETGRTTLIESIFFRLSLEEDTWPPWARSTLSGQQEKDEVLSYLQLDRDIPLTDDMKMEYKLNKYKEYMINKQRNLRTPNPPSPTTEEETDC